MKIKANMQKGDTQRWLFALSWPTKFLMMASERKLVFWGFYIYFFFREEAGPSQLHKLPWRSERTFEENPGKEKETPWLH